MDDQSHDNDAVDVQLTRHVASFAVSAALCSEKVENFYCSDLMISEHLNYMMLISTDVRVHCMPLSNYLKPGDWKNTNEQRDYIMNYENI